MMDVVIDARIDILAYIAWAAAGATMAWLVAARARMAVIVTVVALAGCVALAALLADSRVSPVAGTLVGQGAYLRLWLTAASASLLAVHLIGLVSGDTWRAGPSMLMALSATATGLALHDPIPASVVLGAASLVAAGATHADLASAGPVLVRAAGLSTVLGVSAAALATTVATPGNQLFHEPRAADASLLLAVAAIAVRAGGAPVAQPARSVFSLAPRASSAASWAWLPAAAMLVLVTLATTSFERTGGNLDSTGRIVQLIGLGALLLASSVALLARDVAHILGATVVANGSLVIFALVHVDGTAPTEAIRAAAGWLPVFGIVTSWAVAWLVVAAAGHATLGISAFRGWARKRPLLALALVAGVALSYGWPGTLPWDARLGLIDRLPLGPLRDTALFLSLVPLLGVVRLLLAGARAPTDGSLVVAASDRPVVRRRAGLVPITIRRAPLASSLVLAFAFAPALLVAGAGNLPGVAAERSPEMPEARAIPGSRATPDAHHSAASTQRSISRS